MMLYPQLPHPVAAQLAEELRATSMRVAATRTSHDHSDAYFTPTGGTRADDAQLKLLRSELVRLAQHYGFPEAANDAARAQFDCDVAELLQDSMQLAPGEAAKPGVWEFVACVLACDLVRWRFPGGADGTPVERFIGGRRNTFQRLWWRATVLRDPKAKDPGNLLRALGEDEIVQIMERPFLAGSRNLARAVGTELLAASRRNSTLARRLLIREAQKRVRRLGAYVSFEAVRDDELAAMVRSVFDEVVEYAPH